MRAEHRRSDARWTCRPARAAAAHGARVTVVVISQWRCADDRGVLEPRLRLYVTYSARMVPDGHLVRLELPSSFELLDLVQMLSDRLSSLAGLDEDSTHWVERGRSRIGHQRHQARQSRRSRRSTSRSSSCCGPRAKPEEFVVARARRGRRASIPTHVANPLDPENVLKSSGRGIFFMRSFMDDVSIARRPEGGMSVRMSKKLQCLRLAARPRSSSPPRSRPRSPPAASIGSYFRPAARHPEEGPDRSRHGRRSRGRAGVPRAHRRARFPSHAVLGEEQAAAPQRRAARGTAGSSIRSTARRTSRTASRCSASRSRSRSTARIELGVVFDPIGEELFTAERGQGARLNGQPTPRLDAARS